MTEREYNEAEGVRRSALWRLRESPEKYRYALTHPEAPTPALAFGTAAHKMLLEPESFFSEYAVVPDVDRRTNSGKAVWDRFLSELGGRDIITMDDLEQIQAMTDKARSIPYVQKLLNGQHETPLFWADEDTGEMCKARLDMLAEVDGVLTVADYKTAANARTEPFVNKMYDLGYHLQAYMYTEAAMKSLGLDERPDFVFVVQEKKPPYAVNYIRVTEDVMTAGMDCFRELIGTLHQCKETDYWYGYNGPFDEPNEAFLPGWMQMGEEEE